MKRYSKILALAAVTSVLLVSCDKEWDDAPKYTPAVMTPTMTVAQFKALYQSGPITIETDTIVVAARVISCDQQGNIYRSLYVEDATSGLEIKTGLGSMFGSYPEGMMIYIKPQYLTLGNYRGMISLGFESVDPKYENGYISAPLLIDRSMHRGVIEDKVIPKQITQMSDLTGDKNLMGTLVTIKGATFTRQTSLDTWAQPDNPNTSTSDGAYGQHNLTIPGSTSGQLIVRTSPYCSFAGKVTPATGSIVDITAIVTLFNTTYQLVLNTASDVVVTTQGPI